MPLPAAQVFFRVPDAVTTLELMVQQPRLISQYRAPVQDVIGGRARLVDWQQSNASFFNALSVERNVMFLILTLIILVAAFNIISSLIMLVKDKGSDIAILRTMGATRGSIMRVFSITGTAIGVGGTLIGLILGLIVASNAETLRSFISNLTNVPIFPP